MKGDQRKIAILGGSQIRIDGIMTTWKTQGKDAGRKPWRGMLYINTSNLLGWNSEQLQNLVRPPVEPAQHAVGRWLSR